MIKQIRCALLLALFAVVAACGGSGDGLMLDPDPDPTGEAIEVNGDIETDTTWTSGNTYLLGDHIFVKNSTLTIEPGVTVLGGRGTSLVVTPSGRVSAEGTAAAPIVFTSSQPVGFRSPGDWGGVVLLGNAPINVAGGTNNIEGFANSEDTVYGGADDLHDCGTLRYVRIEFAGFKLSDGNEINGLTLGACGADTVLDFIQVHRVADDGIEFFGGTADLKHAVITQPDDDGLDGDLGWQGRVQFLIVQQNQTVGNYGFEISNNEDAQDATPRTDPTIFNATLIGSNAEPGTAGKTQTPMRLKDGTAATMANLLVMHFADYAIDVTDASTVAQANGGNILVEDSLFFDNANDVLQGWPAGFEGAPDGFDEQAFFTNPANENVFGDDPRLVSPLELAGPAFGYQELAPVLEGSAPVADGFFDTTANFRGAIGNDDWTLGWTAYPEN